MAHTEAGNPGVGPGAGEPAAFAVGVATYNQAQTVGALLQAVEGGLAAALPGRPVVVIHADGGSQDGTLGRAREASTGLLIQVSFALDQLARPGTGLVRPAALRAILGEVGKLGTGCAVLDAEAGGLPSGWIERLGPAGPGRPDGFCRSLLPAAPPRRYHHQRDRIPPPASALRQRASVSAGHRLRLLGPIRFRPARGWGMARGAFPGGQRSLAGDPRGPRRPPGPPRGPS